MHMSGLAVVLQVPVACADLCDVTGALQTTFNKELTACATDGLSCWCMYSNSGSSRHDGHVACMILTAVPCSVVPSCYMQPVADAGRHKAGSGETKPCEQNGHDALS